MDLQTVTKLYNSLGLIREELESLEFWRVYPEVKSIEVSYTGQYDDQGSSCYYIKDIKFVSPEAKRELTLRCFPNVQEEINTWEWKRVLPFTALNIMDDEDEVYTRPDEEEINKEVKALEMKAQTLVVDYLTQRSVNVTVQ